MGLAVRAARGLRRFAAGHSSAVPAIAPARPATSSTLMIRPTAPTQYWRHVIAPLHANTIIAAAVSVAHVRVAPDREAGARRGETAQLTRDAASEANNFDGRRRVEPSPLPRGVCTLLVGGGTRCTFNVRRISPSTRGRGYASRTTNTMTTKPAHRATVPDTWNPHPSDSLGFLKKKIRQVVLAHGGAMDFAELLPAYFDHHSERLTRHAFEVNTVALEQMERLHSRFSLSIRQSFNHSFVDVFCFRRRPDGGSDIIAVGAPQQSLRVGFTLEDAQRNSLLIGRIYASESLRDVLRLVRTGGDHALVEVLVVEAALAQITYFIRGGHDYRKQAAEDKEAMTWLSNAIIASADLMDSFVVDSVVHDCRTLTRQGVELDPAAVRALASQPSFYTCKGRTSSRRAQRTFSISVFLAKYAVDLVDVGRLQAASKKVTCNAAALKTEDVIRMVTACALLVHRGVDVDPVMMKALREQAPRLKNIATRHHVLLELFSIVELSQNGIAIDREWMQNVCRRIVLDVGKSKVDQVSTATVSTATVVNALRAFAELAERGVDVDPKAVQVVSQHAAHLMGAAAHANLSNRHLIMMVSFTLRSLERLEESRVAVDSKTADTLRELLKGSKSERTIEVEGEADGRETYAETAAVSARDHQAPLTDAADRWLAALPNSARAKLAASLSEARSDDRLKLLMQSVESDTTKARAVVKRAIQEKLHAAVRISS
mmetsp:Transcript_36007/g.89892  ORF Transcript_36007/g.89892 Transcript_36007/m.89892 type:complete len:717 (-) Transcript_36007:326-2476(-)